MRAVCYSRAVIRCAVAVALLSACTPAGAEDPVLAWRRRLADPAAFSVREGMQIRDDALRAAILQGRAEHGELLARRWDAELRALGELPAPTEPEYRTVATIRAPGEAREVEPALQLADRGLPGTLRRSLSMVLPLTMTQELGMTPADVGRWLGFLSLAEPALGRCGEAAVCMSYGGLDVFVFSLTGHDGATVVESIRWAQRVHMR